MKKSRSLMFKFSVIFLIFAIIIMLVAGVATYFMQMNDYRKTSEKSIRNVSEYLTSLMNREGSDTIWYQEYFLNHYRELEIPYDFDNYMDAYDEFQKLFAKQYPGMVLGVDINIEDTSKEVQDAYCIYDHEYWVLTFEAARDSFGLPYCYYLVMSDDRSRLESLEEGEDTDYNVLYLIDAERTVKEVNEYEGEGEITEDDVEDKHLYLGDTYYNNREKYDVMWNTWETGEKQDGYMEWDNEWGHTYGYYTPLIINGKKLGLVASEIDFETVNRNILRNTFVEIGILGVVLITGFLLMLGAIRLNFIVRVERLEKTMYAYSKNKDLSVVGTVTGDSSGGDEISSLGRQFVEMIQDLHEYMANLQATTEQLHQTEQREFEMSELATKDSLTGVRNKTAYDREVEKLQKKIDADEAVFGIVMVDMNGLKDINDNHGHGKGDIAIKELCQLVCDVFVHSPVFRIGGDEFVVILTGDDYVAVDHLIELFNKEVKRREEDYSIRVWDKASAAVGYALYDDAVDGRSYESVFRRADEAMYKRKEQMKGEV